MPGSQPALSLEEATANLRPDEALEYNDPWYVPLMEGRGDDPLKQLRKLFDRKRKDDTIRAVFACHRGAGKSTELKHFTHDLKGKYEPLFLEANVEFDYERFEIEDLLLVLAREIEKKMRVELGTPLPDKTLTEVEEWFSKTVVTHTFSTDYLASIKTQAKAQAGVPFFAKLFAEFTALFKTESKHKTEIKNELKKYPGTLLELTNRLLADATEKLPDEKRLLLVIDNMDRYKPETIDHLLIKERERLKALDVNIIFTPPVTLLYRPPSERLDTLYDVIHLPTVKLRNPLQPSEEVGRPGHVLRGYDLFREVLSRRMDLGRFFEDEALRRLIAATGGSVRELIYYARAATLEAEGGKVTTAEVENVLRRERQRNRDFIAANDYFPALAELGAVRGVTKNPKCLDLLYHRLAYRYNGEGWYDVHPLVAEMAEYQTELKKHQPLTGLNP